MHEIGLNKSTVERSALTVSQNERFQHTYVVGQTGTGKSTWLKNSFLQDIHAGFGACYFDFHGGDAEWLLDRIPEDRIGDVAYIDPNDPTHADRTQIRRVIERGDLHLKRPGTIHHGRIAKPKATPAAANWGRVTP